MKTDQEVRKLAKEEFDSLGVYKDNALTWSVWKAAYHLGYKQGIIDTLEASLIKD